MCTRPSRFLSSSLRILHIYSEKHLSQNLLLGWNREEIGMWDLLPEGVKKKNTYISHWMPIIRKITRNKIMFYTYLLKFFFFSSLFPVKSIIFVALIISIVNAETQNIRVANSDGRGERKRMAISVYICTSPLKASIPWPKPLPLPYLPFTWSKDSGKREDFFVFARLLPLPLHQSFRQARKRRRKRVGKVTH